MSERTTVKCPKCQHIHWSDEEHECPTAAYAADLAELIEYAAKAEVAEDDEEDEVAPRRTHYRNGDEIGMAWNGCDGCSPAMINGILCHEHGCPDAWRDKTVECFECGCDFFPEESRQRLCNDCLNPEPFEDEEDDQQS
jgi:hypothetical protein